MPHKSERVTEMAFAARDLAKQKWGVGLGVVALGALALVVWVIWRPAPSVPGVLEVNGRIEGDQAAVGPKVGGQLVRLAVREGDTLEAGELVAELASDQLEAQLAQAEHVLHTARERLAEARARLVTAQRQREGAELAVTLAERESGARIRETEAALGAARARLRQAEADAEKAAKDHDRHRELFARDRGYAKAMR